MRLLLFSLTYDKYFLDLLGQIQVNYLFVIC